MVLMQFKTWNYHIIKDHYFVHTLKLNDYQKPIFIWKHFKILKQDFKTYFALIFLINFKHRFIILHTCKTRFPVHPGLHVKQFPNCMWHILSLQLIGHWISQLLPYTPRFPQPYKIKKNIGRYEYTKIANAQLSIYSLYMFDVFFFFNIPFSH